MPVNFEATTEEIPWAHNNIDGETGITFDAYTKDEVDDKIENMKSKFYNLLRDLKIDISEEDFYEALK